MLKRLKYICWHNTCVYNHLPIYGTTDEFKKLV